MTTPPLIRFIVCVGDVCDREGRGSALLERLSRALRAEFAGEIEAGRVACATRACLRHCSRGDPVLRIEPSGEVYADASVGFLLDLAEAALESGGGRG